MAIKFEISASQELRIILSNQRIRPIESATILAALIFLRWVDFQDAEASAIAAFDELEFISLLPTALQWRRWHNLPQTELHHLLSERLPAEISKIKTDHEPIAGLLRRVTSSLNNISSFSPEALYEVTGWLAQKAFETPADRRNLLAEFDEFLESILENDAGQFRTPASINRLLVEIASPKTGDKIYDPCFGFGGNLTAAWEHLRNSDQGRFTASDKNLLSVSGVEINPCAFIIGLARIVLAGISNPQLELGNCLERETATNPRKDGFDVILCNPPWGTKIDPQGLDHFPIQTNDGTSLFIQHAISQLRPKGRAVIVVPQGFLFQQGKTVNVRKWLLDEHAVDAVINLPAGAFQPYTFIQASILILRRNGGPTKQVRMVDGTAFFAKAAQSRSVHISSEKIEELIEATLTDQPKESAWDVDASLFPDLGYDLSVKRRDVNTLELALESLGKDVPIVLLKDVCRVTSGKTLSKEDLNSSPDAENSIPYIRIGDIERGKTVKATSWLSGDSLLEINPRNRLKPGDVLVSKAGTIGKAGIVRNGAVGGVASGTLFILTPDASKLDPHFLTAYLLGKECQKWLQSRSSGSIISGLKKHFIESIAVPLPPLLVQQRVATAFREHQEDAIKTLANFLSPEDSNPLFQWISESLQLLEKEKPEDSSDPSQLIRFKVFGQEMVKATLDNQRINEVPELREWARNMEEVEHALRDSEHVGRGPALYGIFQMGIAPLRGSLEKIKGNSLMESQARELTKKCILCLELASMGLYDPKAIEVQVLTDTLVADQENEVSIIVKNRGVLPIRTFTISTPQDNGMKPVYLQESSERRFNLTIRPESDVDSYTATINWYFVALGGEPEWGEQEVAFKVTHDSTTPLPMELGSSPYFISEPVGPSRRDIFIGREEILHRIKSQLQSGNTVLLEGNRRAGKTSILKQLEGLNAIPGRLAVYSSMQAAEGNSTLTGMTSEAVWRTLAKSMASGLCALECDVPLPDGSVLLGGKGLGIAKACRNGIGSDAPWEDFLEYASLVTNILAEHGRGLVVMIDEFDKLQEGIDNGITSPQIPENIRYLIQNLPGFSAILTGSRRMQRLRHEYWSALYGLGARIGVTALDSDAARRLVRQPVEGRLNYSEEAVSLLIDLCARQPFLIQSLANLVFESMVQSGARLVTAATVEAAAMHFVEHNEHFNSLMDYTETDQRRFLIMLVHRATKDPYPVTFGNLQDRLLRIQIELPDEALIQDLRFLMDLELIDYHGTAGGIYSLTVPLMGHWLDFQHDYHALLAKARFEQENQL